MMTIPKKMIGEKGLIPRREIVALVGVYHSTNDARVEKVRCRI